MDEASFIEHSAHEKTHWWFQARREIVRRLLIGLVGDREEPTILEIGCGTGCTVEFLRSGSLENEKANPMRVSGVDISRHAIRIGRRDYPEADLRAYQDIDEISDAIKAADCILLLDVIEHVENDLVFLASITQHMSIGSKLLITVPADPELWSQHDEALFHYRRYSVERLTAAWSSLPMRCLVTSGLNWRLAPLIRTVRWLGKKFGHKRSGATGPKSDLKLPNPIVNRILRGIFTSEAAGLVRKWNEGDSGETAHCNGVSLVAVLQRTDGEVDFDGLPEHLLDDQHQPHPFDLGNES